jgi:hypothetical protein
VGLTRSPQNDRGRECTRRNRWRIEFLDDLASWDPVEGRRNSAQIEAQLISWVRRLQL